MVLKPDQEHIRGLLAETITLLCCNGLHFKSEFSIDALIGITIDQNEVFLVSVKETFQNGRTVHSNKRQQTSRPINRESSSSCDFNDSGSSDVSKRMWNSDEGQEVLVNDSDSKDIYQYSNLTQNFNSRNPKLTGNKRKHRIPSKFGLGQKELSDSISGGELAYGKPVKRLLVDTPETFVHCVDEDDSVRYLDDTFAMAEVLSKSEDLQRTHVLRHERIKDLTESCEKKNSGLVESQDHDDRKSVQIKQEPVEKSLLPTNRPVNGSNSRPRPASSLGRNARSLLSSVCSQNSFYLRLEDSIPGCSSWNARGSSDELTMSYPNHSRWLIEPIDTKPTEREVDTPSGRVSQNLTAEEISVARSILSMRGQFISFGCLKANRQCLRNYTREHLIAILEKLSAPSDRALFIGLLYTFGATRIFFKCPPSEVASEALDYFGFSPLSYAECFNEPVIVDKNIRHPVAWIEKILERSPFK